MELLNANFVCCTYFVRQRKPMHVWCPLNKFEYSNQTFSTAIFAVNVFNKIIKYIYFNTQCPY